MVEEVLAENNVLKTKMLQLQDSFDARSTFTLRLDDSETILQLGGENRDDASTIRGISRSNTIQSIRASTLRFAFENVLEQSWVYRRNQSNECDKSFISSAQRSHAWSVFSGYSLADISVISVIAMPITVLDIANGMHYEARESGAGNYALYPDFDHGRPSSPADSVEDSEERGISTPPNTPTMSAKGLSAGKCATASDRNESIDTPSGDIQHTFETNYENVPCTGCGEVSDEL